MAEKTVKKAKAKPKKATTTKARPTRSKKPSAAKAKPKKATTTKARPTRSKKPKTGRSKPRAKSKSDPLGSMGIVIVDDDLGIDQDKINEERRAYLEEARSQEAFD